MFSAFYLGKKKDQVIYTISACIKYRPLPNHFFFLTEHFRMIKKHIKLTRFYRHISLTKVAKRTKKKKGLLFDGFNNTQGRILHHGFNFNVNDLLKKNGITN